MITMGRLAAITSIGRRLPNESRREKMILAASLPLRPSTFLSLLKDVLNACVLMIMT